MTSLIERKCGWRALLHKGEELAESPTAASWRWAQCSARRQTRPGHTPWSCSLPGSSSIYVLLACPPSLPSCLSHSQRPFRAYLTKQHTTHAAYVSPPCSSSHSPSEKTEILSLAAAVMSHDLTPPPTSPTPSPPPLSTYNSSAIWR